MYSLRQYYLPVEVDSSRVSPVSGCTSIIWKSLRRGWLVAVVAVLFPI